MDADLFLAAKLVALFNPELWAALAKRRVASLANMQLLVTQLGRRVWH